MASYYCTVDYNHSSRVGASLAAFYTVPQFPDLRKQPKPQGHESAHAAPHAAMAAASNLHGIFSWFSSHNRSKSIGVSSMMSVESSPKAVISSDLPTTAIVPLEPPRIQPLSPCDSVQHPDGSCMQSCSASIPIVVRRRIFSLDKQNSVSIEDGSSHENSENEESKQQHGACKRLERIYDQRTWAMYSLITNARKRMAKCSVVQAATIQPMSDCATTGGGYCYPSFGPQQQHVSECSQCLPNNIVAEHDSYCREEEDEDDDEDTCSLTSYSWDYDMVFELEDYR
jgi:hypothetical protein